jgi:hypothetical protein
MISRSGDTITFVCKPEDVVILDFIESRLQLLDLDFFIQTFIDQRRQQREFDVQIDLNKMLDDPLAVADIEQAIQEFKDRHGIP